MTIRPSQVEFILQIYAWFGFNKFGFSEWAKFEGVSQGGDYHYFTGFQSKMERLEKHGYAERIGRWNWKLNQQKIEDLND